MQATLHGNTQLEGSQLKGEHAGFDLGEIQDVVDDGQEGIGARPDGVGERALFGREFRVEQQTDHADDPVEGRADLVAHVRQELGFSRALACASFTATRNASSVRFAQ